MTTKTSFTEVNNLVSTLEFYRDWMTYAVGKCIIHSLIHVSGTCSPITAYLKTNFKVMLSLFGTTKQVLVISTQVHYLSIQEHHFCQKLTQN